MPHGRTLPAVHGLYGIAWFAGSAAIGALFNLCPASVVIFAVAAELATIPLILLVCQHHTTTAVPPASA